MFDGATTTQKIWLLILDVLKPLVQAGQPHFHVSWAIGKPDPLFYISTVPVSVLETAIALQHAAGLQ